MALLYCLSLVSLIHAEATGSLSQSTIDSFIASEVDDCTPKQESCWDPLGADPYVDYTISTITLDSITEEGGACCYKYIATHDHTALDCNDKSSVLSHWNLGYVCPQATEGATITVSGDGSLVDDANTCINGIKFNTGCGKGESPCTYNICIEFSDHVAGKCCAEKGWYLIKAGSTSAVAETQVPICVCPTLNPSSSPTKSPTRNPSESPTKDPTKSPTNNPSVPPTKQPTKSPTNNPSRAPTDYPTDPPTPEPTDSPTPQPTDAPTPEPSDYPSPSPTDTPTPQPTESPITEAPTTEPSDYPSPSPTDTPTPQPTDSPITEAPTTEPSDYPTDSPTETPTPQPTYSPTPEPSDAPTPEPSDYPSPSPTETPTPQPTDSPTPQPTAYCRPVVEIWVNKGCESDNIELSDTDVWYTNIQEYDSVSDFGNVFNGQPSDGLSQTILSHACSTDAGAQVSQLGYANAPRIQLQPRDLEPQPYIPQRHPFYGDVYHEYNVKMNQWDSYHIGLLIYGLVLTAVLLVLCGTKSVSALNLNEHPSKGFRRINGVDEDDATNDEENAYML